MENIKNKIKKYFFWLNLLFNKKKLHYLYLTNLHISDYVALFNWAKNDFNVPYPRFVKEQVFKKYNLSDSFWIETGTHYGDTSLYLSRFAKKVITLEPSEKIYNAALEKLKNIENITVMNKTSEDGLEEALEQIPDKSNVCFWLDGHYSEGDTYLGNKHSPIEFELEKIGNNLSRFKKINILIDDFRLFQDYETNDIYPNKKFLTEWVSKNNLNFEVEADIFIIIKN